MVFIELINRLIKLFKQKDGSITFTVILLILSILAIILFVGFDYPRLISNNNSLSYCNDLIAKGAISQWDIKKGWMGMEDVVVLDEEKAIAKAKDLLKKNLKLDDDYEPVEGSILYDKPDIDIQIINPEFPTFVDGIGFIENPTVIVKSKYRTRSGFSKRVLEHEKESIYELVYEEKFGKIDEESVKVNKRNTSLK